MDIKSKRTDYTKNLLLIIFFSVTIMAVGSLILMGALTLYSGESFETVSGWISHPMGSRHVGELKLFQIVYGLNAFIIAGYVSANWISGGTALDYLGLKRLPNSAIIAVSIAMMVSFLPFINALGAWNMQMSFPESLVWLEEWMLNQQLINDKLMTQFLESREPIDLVVNLIMIALIPALGEEIIFRGLIQKQFKGLFKSQHAAVWVTAILFSAIHLQFYGFIPRLILGVVFGYLVVYTNSLWPSIVAHFVNNAVAVILTWSIGIDRVNQEVDRLGASTDQWPMVVISAFVGGLCFWFIIKYSSNRNGAIIEP